VGIVFFAQSIQVVIIKTIGGILLIILAKAIISLDLIRPLKGTAMIE